MISRLSGILIEKKPPLLMVDVQGVGYELQAPMSTFYRLPEVGQPVVLLTHLIVREDAHLLFGFSQAHERELFRQLLKVSNVGPKSALTILSGIEAEAFVRCVMLNDVTSLAKLPGIGKKTAERLVIEMRDRLQTWQQTAPSVAVTAVENEQNSAVEDAISALIALGYKAVEARQTVLRVETQDANRETLIRLALQQML